MAPTLHPRSALVARDPALSPGGIAGAVIGSVFGAGLVLLILGFLYFRHRRLSNEALAKEGTLPTAKPEIQGNKKQHKCFTGGHWA